MGIHYDSYIVQKVNEYHSAREKIKQWLQLLQTDEQFFFEVAVNEALNNALYHGNEEEEVHVRILFQADKEKLTVSIEDNGIGITEEGEILYEQKSDNVFKEAADTLRESGRGIAIMKECSDQLILEEGGRCVTLVKNI
ncbi:ATP-binding protein [Alteribacillus sp. JSM 102045]|uniref:ATP-binding protein n=1 Tax=Alteribacillus sp. JSM 102045 TaxID=1562101 RepID=UPI0035C09FC1